LLNRDSKSKSTQAGNNQDKAKSKNREPKHMGDILIMQIKNFPNSADVQVSQGVATCKVKLAAIINKETSV
jgi:hypothetical protein